MLLLLPPLLLIILPEERVENNNKGVAIMLHYLIKHQYNMYNITLF